MALRFDIISGNWWTGIDSSYSWSQLYEISIWSSVQELAEAAYGYCYFRVHSSLLCHLILSYKILLCIKTLVKYMLTLFPCICRYNFCEDFYGEQHMFYEIFSGIVMEFLNFVECLQSLSNRWKNFFSLLIFKMNFVRFGFTLLLCRLQNLKYANMGTKVSWCHRTFGNTIDVGAW